MFAKYARMWALAGLLLLGFLPGLELRPVCLADVLYRVDLRSVATGPMLKFFLLRSAVVWYQLIDAVPESTNCRSKSASLRSGSSNSAPTDQGISVHPTPVDHQPDEIESCVVIDPLILKGTLQHSTLLGEASSKSSLDMSEVKEEANNDVMVECLSSGNEKASHPPLCEATLVVKAPSKCPCAGEARVFHVSPGGEMLEHVDSAEDGSGLPPLPPLSEVGVSQ
ncbi:hypothetical protein Nepgr_009343 [Nepenthes gracilis]|uniref:Uncharacterized protein n=1 Tax=Nepenthes gracilis TaxID=150966 RepID=A0AAD3SAF7_NEPGR|nr:hypothetical protein Nepgr_009343 [Nepenthes gracilis]